MFNTESHKETTEAIERHGAKWLRSKYAGSFLALISFAESVFAPIIIDPFLIAMIVASPKKWKRFTVISIVASVIGGIVAYFLGVWFFDTLGVKLLAFYHLESLFAEMTEKLNDNGFVFVLIGAFTPIPYKVVALASGVLQINFLTFLAASLVGRILRLGLVGVATHMVGEQAVALVRRHLHTIAAVSGVILIIYLLLRLI